LAGRQLDGENNTLQCLDGRPRFRHGRQPRAASLKRSPGIRADSASPFHFSQRGQRFVLRSYAASRPFIVGQRSVGKDERRWAPAAVGAEAAGGI